MLQPIAIDTSDFPKIRRQGKIYVDKTGYFHKLITGDSDCHFLARPRRFGKSLMISTLKAIFEGRRELFDGLAISKTDWKWEAYPVLYFNFGFAARSFVDEFRCSFPIEVERGIVAAGGSYNPNKQPSDNFGEAIQTLSATSNGKGVVILIDEYDAPVGHALGDVDFAENIRDRLSSVYSQMKNRTGDIRFLFMTGVSKFTKLSVFSALNNLVDVSQDDEYATMFGYTEEELSANFEEHLRAHAEKMGKSYEDYREEMKKWYNGFRFARNVETTVYNPISVAYTLYKKEPGFTATWSSTGRPSMLMNYLQREELLAIDYEDVEGVAEAEFDVAELRRLRPIAMLYQSGYLTIKDYDCGLYTLGVPDEEVRRDLATLIAGAAADENMQWAASLGAKLVTAQWPMFFVGLKSLYAHMPYGSLEGTIHEHSYARILCTLLASQGVTYRAEDVQSNGRADLIAEHRKGIFIFELKVDEPVDKAFAQIRA